MVVYVRETKVPLTAEIDEFLKKTGKPIIHILKEYKEIYEILYGKIAEFIRDFKETKEIMKEQKELVRDLKEEMHKIEFLSKGYEEHAKRLWNEMLKVFERINEKVSLFENSIDDINKKINKIEEREAEFKAIYLKIIPLIYDINRRFFELRKNIKDETVQEFLKEFFRKFTILTTLIEEFSPSAYKEAYNKILPTIEKEEKKEEEKAEVIV